MRGLTNCGNSCYFNTAVQCLAHIPSLSNHLIHFRYTGECQFTQEYRRTIRELFSKAKFEPVCSQALIGAFKTQFPRFDNLNQHDSQEVVLCIIDTLEKSLGKEFIKNIFNGEETTETHYPGGKSEYKNDFTTQLFIVNENSDLLDLVKNKKYFQNISGYRDENGTEHEHASTRTIVTRWPKIISFTFGMYGRKCVIRIPDVFEDKKLFAVIVHQGGMRGGHYAVAILRNDVWYLKDDETVTKLSEPPVQGHFYMVWYR